MEKTKTWKVSTTAKNDKGGESLPFFYSQKGIKVIPKHLILTMHIECTLAYNLCPMKAKSLVNSVSDLKQAMTIMEELKWSKYEDGSLYEYLQANTEPTSGTWGEWFGWFFIEWLQGDDNTFNGRTFYNWLLKNYF